METKVTVKTMEENKLPKMIAMLGALGVIVAAFLPWAITAGITVKGTDGDGTITLAIAALAIIFLWIRKIPAWISAILGVVLAAIGAIDFTQVKEAVTLEGGSVGSGLYLTMAGAVVLVIGSAWHFFQRRR